MGWWSGGSGVANAFAVGGNDRVRQRPQQGPLWVEDLHDTPVETDGDTLPGQVVPDRVLRSGEAGLAAGVD
jgi:hypothetical protein